MDKKIVLVSFLLAGLIALVTLMACNKIQQPAEPEYEFVTLFGERKIGWCDTRLEVPKCKSEFNVWYEVKQYGSIWEMYSLNEEEIRQKYGTIRLKDKEN